MYICSLCRPQNVCPRRDSPDDIHSAVENENTVLVSAELTSKRILPFGFAELYCCRCSRHGASCMQLSALCIGAIRRTRYYLTSHLDGWGRCRHPKFEVVLCRGPGVFQVIRGRYSLFSGGHILSSNVGKKFAKLY